MARIAMIRMNSGLVPMDEMATATLANYGYGEEVVIDLTKHRNPRFHRYAFANFQLLHDLADTDKPFDQWRKELTILAGYYKAWGLPDGRTGIEAESLSFSNMDEHEFKTCWGNIIQAFLNHHGARLSEEDVWRVIRL